MALPSITDLKMWVGTLFTKDDWDYNFSQLVSWLADGNSDIVVNSVKATNGIDLDGAQISNVGAAETGSQAINLDQALTLLNRTSYYYPYSVASGKVDNDGNSAFLEIADDSLKVLAGNVNPDLVCIQSDGTIESVTSDTTLTKPTADGVYHIIKEKGEEITITGGSVKVTVADKAPTANVGDYWLDTSVSPFVGRKSDGGWTSEDTIQPFCYLGYVTVSSGVITLYPAAFNSNIEGDGQWVGITVQLSNSNSGTYNIDLSSYLPNDEYAYEVLLGCEMYTDGVDKFQQLSSSIITSWVNANHTESYADGSSECNMFPIGSDKKLNYRITGSGGSVALYLFGYRRIGTNN